MAAPKREVTVGFRVRPHEAAAIKAAASAESVTVSEFVRGRILPEARSVVSGRDRSDGSREQG